ncbi:MAG: hypothetical protein K6T81_18075 [Alicyclobacillus macrosporangiidus]|uniref:hypothetical protein n=1 Tax=Alicyclobacillus macrosporangiidus TaxID=392015 RepID=UPI0026F1312F|nr:hypothetical protein [Alicyclobacillus macrosporangiidus]MCL6600617.1 hypothetical protein [Alicyclobacillus macrosporangiidus]
MQVMRILGYAVAVALAALLAQQVATTYYVARIDAGLRTSLSATRQLGDIQAAVIEKNGALQQMQRSSQTALEQLKAALAATQAIDHNISEIDDLNAATRHINDQLATAGRSGQETLADIAKALGQLQDALAGLGSNVDALHRVVQSDAANLADMRQQVHEMDAKIPGLLR